MYHLHMTLLEDTNTKAVEYVRGFRKGIPAMIFRSRISTKALWEL